MIFTFQGNLNLGSATAFEIKVTEFQWGKKDVLTSRMFQCNQRFKFMTDTFDEGGENARQCLKICSRIVMVKQLEFLIDMIHEILMSIVLVRFMNCYARQWLMNIVLVRCESQAMSKDLFNNCHAKIVGISE